MDEDFIMLSVNLYRVILDDYKFKFTKKEGCQRVYLQHPLVSAKLYLTINAASHVGSITYSVSSPLTI